MGMSTHAVGFKPADDQWKKMKAVWDSCVEAGCGIPEVVDAFFDGEDPRDKPGMEVELGEACQPWGAEFKDGYQIDVTKLPEGVRYIRVYNCY